MRKKNPKQTKNETTTNRKELILPTEISFGLKSLIHGREGMFFNPNGLELLNEDSWEFKFFCCGVEKYLPQLKMTEEIFQNLKSMSKSVQSGNISGITFKYKLPEVYSKGLKSIHLLNDSDWWYILWKGWGFVYNDPEKYDENYRIANKIHFMIEPRNSKFDINDITMVDINNFNLPT